MNYQIHRGFSLIELILAIGILAIVISAAGSLFYAQITRKNNPSEPLHQLNIINDFYVFTQIESFNRIKQISEQDTPLYVINNEQDGIIFREFVPRNVWLNTDEAHHEYYAIKIDQTSDLFSDDGDGMRPYLPLMCKLLKIYPNGSETGCMSFVAVKVY